jgi:hypothetical protein
MAYPTNVPDDSFTITGDRLLSANLRGGGLGMVATGRSPTYRI